VTEFKRPIAIVLPDTSSSGAKKVMVDIGRGIAQLGHPVDLVIASRDTNVQPLPNLRFITLGVCQGLCRWQNRIYSLLPLVRYFRRRFPIAVIPVYDFLEPVVILALKLSRIRARLIFTMHNATTFLQDLSNPKRTVVEKLFSLTLRRADTLVAVSHGVAQDWARYFGIDRSRITVIYNPLDAQRIQSLSQAPIERPEIARFLKTREPTIIAVGRLEPQKDFSTLLKAFAKVRQHISCRLLLLGEGSERNNLEKLINELKLREAVLMPGFVQNPYPYMAKASMLVLSSRYEGFPTVILEALSLGLPVVSTDCPHGSSEILEKGRYGTLVPVGDVNAIAEAILETLAKPHNRSLLQARAREFSPEKIASEYLGLIKNHED